MKSIVLLSGGMDSAVAYYWAKKSTKIVTELFFDYGQKGVGWERIAASSIAQHAVHRVQIYYPPSIRSTILTNSDMYEVKRRDVPASFVPGRNLTMISIAGGVAYELGAELIIGGWTQVDVDYPDCSSYFLRLAGDAACEAIGGKPGSLEVFSPILYYNKSDIVRMGEELGVPWKDTRSCYGNQQQPCMNCGSCLKRATAFLKAGVRDPIVSDERWDDFVETHSETEV